MHALLHSVPPALQQATTDSHLCRLLDTMGKSGSVSSGITASFSGVLVHTSFCLCPPIVCCPVLCKFWWLYGGVNGDLLQEGLRHTQVCCTQDRWVMVESYDKTRSTGEGNGKLLQYSCLENPMNSMKKQKDRTLKDELPRSVGAQYATGDQ